MLLQPLWPGEQQQTGSTSALTNIMSEKVAEMKRLRQNRKRTRNATERLESSSSSRIEFAETVEGGVPVGS